MEYPEKIKESASFIREHMELLECETALILGSGLADFASTLDILQTIPLKDIPHFPIPGVQGHGSRLILGRAAGVKVLCLEGRVHYYEGYGMEEVTFGIRVISSLGLKRLILTNAAGGLRGSAGDLMIMEDHLDLFCPNPLRGPNIAPTGKEQRFPDMTGVYSRELRKAALEIAEKEGIPAFQGVYAFLSGPSYETPADIRALGILGVDAVGMSTVPEAIVAAHSGMEVLGISCITNQAAGMSGKPLTHEEVMEAGARVSKSFTVLLHGILKRLGS